MHYVASLESIHGGETINIQFQQTNVVDAVNNFVTLPEHLSLHVQADPNRQSRGQRLEDHCLPATIGRELQVHLVADCINDFNFSHEIIDNNVAILLIDAAEITRSENQTENSCYVIVSLDFHEDGDLDIEFAPSGEIEASQTVQTQFLSIP
ncbi:MAG: hypothetical protein OEZ58_09105 [Gammaproteobacteria bacterium]|nr:hypothetical protein [Gammaproteobacteria bacterium]